MGNLPNGALCGCMDNTAVDDEFRLRRRQGRDGNFDEYETIEQSVTQTTERVEPLPLVPSCGEVLVDCQDVKPYNDIDIEIVAHQEETVLVKGTFVGHTTIRTLKRILLTKTGIPIARQKIGLDSMDRIDNSCTIAEIAQRFGVVDLRMVLRTFLGPFALTGSLDGSIYLWDLAFKKTVQEIIRSTANVEGSAILKGVPTPPVSCLGVDWQAQVAMSGGTRPRLWNLGNGDEMNEMVPGPELKGPKHQVQCLAMDWESRRAIFPDDQGNLRLWDVKANQPIKDIKVHSRVVSCIDVNWTRMRALSASKNGSMVLVDLEQGIIIREFHGNTGWVQAVSAEWLEGSPPFGADSGRALSGGEGGMLRQWDMASGALVMELKGHLDMVQCVSVSWSGNLAISGAMDQMVLLWDLTSGHLLREMRGHTGWVQCLCIHPELPLAVSGGEDRRLRVWNLDTGECVAQMQAHSRTITCMSVDWGANGGALLETGADAGATQGALSEHGKKWDMNGSRVYDESDPCISGAKVAPTPQKQDPDLLGDF